VEHIVNKVYNDILEFGAVQRGWMGVIAETVTDLDIKKFGLEDVSGIQLKSITRNSAADQAGLEKNDIILHINAERVTSVADFNGKLAMHRPGDVLQLKIYRNEQLINEKVTLLNHLNTTDFVAIRKDKILKQIGIEIRELSSEEKERTNKPKGIKVLSILQSSPAQLANMENNYIITAINGSDFKTAQNAVDLINKNKKRLQFDGFYEGYPGSYSYSIDLD